MIKGFEDVCSSFESAALFTEAFEARKIMQCNHVE